MSEQAFPLTRQQQGLWIEDRLHPQNTSYNTAVQVKLEGPLDIQKFEQASRDVIDFFETLKVYFRQSGNGPEQVLQEAVSFDLVVEDISDGEKTESVEKSEQARALLAKQLATAIDLTKFPIMRGLLIKTASQTFYFIGMVPHIVSDGRSAVLYLEALSVAYNQGKEGLRQKYGTTKKGWADYYQDNMGQLDSDFAEEAKSYWQQQLAGASHYFDYSHGRAGYDNHNKQGRRVYFDLRQSLADELKLLARKNRTTLFNVFACAFSVFVYKYFGLNDVLIGYPVNVRPRGYQHFFGFFVNIVPIRLQLTASQSFQQFLQAATAQRKKDKRYQQYPALDIVAAIREKNPSFDGRLFNLSMAQTVSRLFDLELEGIKTTPIETEYFDVNDDFSLSYELIDQRIGLWFEYRQALFSESFVQQAMVHIESILQQIATDPEKTIGEVSLYANSQYDKLAGKSRQFGPAVATGKPLLNDEFIPLSNRLSQSLHQLPERNALVDSDGTINCQSLDKITNQIANYLLESGLTAGDKVALQLPPGRNRIIALVALVKSGLCFVPLACGLPAARTRHILSQLQPDLIISDKDRTQSMVEYGDFETINFSQLLQAVKHYSELTPSPRITAESSAYIIFTSGSSGEPKGVVMSQQALSSRLAAMSQHLSLPSGAVVLQATDYSFDVSVIEIFWSLLQGATLAIFEDRGQHQTNPSKILKAIEQFKVNTCFMVPSLLQTLLQLKDTKIFWQSIKMMILAGETLTESLAERWLSVSDGALYNFYGPTESCVYVSASRITPSNHNKQTVNKEIDKVTVDEVTVDKVTVDKVTIGKPLPGVQFLIRAADGSLLPQGVVGELVICGRGLADGYLNQRLLTEEKFVSMARWKSEGIGQFADNKTESLTGYLSGDLALINERGDTEIIGRIDQQVKVRGYRIELEEIEQVISAGLSEGVKAEVCCLLSEEAVPRIFAFVHFLDDKDSETCLLSMERAKSVCIEQLPAYMMPAKFVVVAELPRLASGKLDKKRLLAQIAIEQQHDLSSEVETAEGVEQKLIANIWSALLKIPLRNLDIHTSFFALGGDSLMAIQFVSMLEEKGFQVDTNIVFEQPTISALSQSLTAKTVVNTENSVAPVAGRYGLLPRQAKFFADQFQNPDYWNRTFSFEANENIDREALLLSLAGLLHWHDNLRVSFIHNEDGEWCQQIAQSLDVVSLLHQVDAESEQSIQQTLNKIHQEIRLDSAPLLRLVWFKAEGRPDKISLLMHHLLIDMVSSRILFEDWIRLYRCAEHWLEKAYRKSAKKAERKAATVCFEQINLSDFLHTVGEELPSKTTSVKDYVNLLMKPLPEARRREADKYWLKMKSWQQPQLKEKGLIENLEGDSLTKEIWLDESVTEKLLRNTSPAMDVPFQNLLAASVFYAISQLGAGQSLVYATCSHGRQEEQGVNLSRTAGWINTVYPVYLESANMSGPLDGAKSHALVTEIDKQMKMIPAHTGDYNRLRYTLKEPAYVALNYPPFFFNYVGQIDAIIPPGLPFQPVAEFPGVAGCGPENHLCYWLYLEAAILSGKLLFRLTYSQKLFNEEEIQIFERALTSCLEHISNN